MLLFTQLIKFCFAEPDSPLIKRNAFFTAVITSLRIGSTAFFKESVIAPISSFPVSLVNASNKINWRKLILIGFFASIFNSFFSSIYLSGFNFKQFDLIYKKLNKNGHLIIIDFNPTFKHTNRHHKNNKLKT